MLCAGYVQPAHVRGGDVHHHPGEGGRGLHPAQPADPPPQGLLSGHPDQHE